MQPLMAAGGREGRQFSERNVSSTGWYPTCNGH